MIRGAHRGEPRVGLVVMQFAVPGRGSKYRLRRHDDVFGEEVVQQIVFRINIKAFVGGFAI